MDRLRGHSVEYSIYLVSSFCAGICRLVGAEHCSLYFFNIAHIASEFSSIFRKKDLMNDLFHQVFDSGELPYYSTILIGRSFFDPSAATLTLAARFSAISRKATATGESG